MANSNTVYVDFKGRGSKTVVQSMKIIGNQIQKVKETFDAFNNPVSKVTTLTKFTKVISKARAEATRMHKIGKKFSGGQVIGMDFEDWKKFNKQGNIFTKGSARIANGARKMIHGMRGFRMEMLSVMFGAQMVSKAMWGLLKPAMNLTGAFELFSTMLQITFLPIAMWLLENFFLPLFKAFTDLDPGIQMAIGAFVLFAGVISSLLAIGAALMLFLAGLILSLPLLTTAWTAGWAIISSIFTALAATFAIVLAAIILLIIGFVVAWKENFANIRDWVALIWEGIKNIFQGGLDFIKGLWEMIVGFFTGDTEKIKEGFWLMWEGIKKMFLGAIQFLVGLLTTLGIVVLRLLIGAGLAVFTALKLIFWDLPLLLWDVGVEAAKKLWEALKSGTAKVRDWFLSLLPEWAFNIVSKLVGGRENAKNSNQSGGYIPHTGLYKLHAGETVEQAGSNNSFSPSIVVNATSNVDIEQLKTQLSSQWNDDLGRLSRR